MKGKIIGGYLEGSTGEAYSSWFDSETNRTKHSQTEKHLLEKMHYKGCVDSCASCSCMGRIEASVVCKLNMAIAIKLKNLCGVCDFFQKESSDVDKKQ